MVVQGGVQVGVSRAVAAVLVGPAGCPAEDLVAAGVGNAAELLDIYVDQFPGPGTPVSAHGLAGGPVQRGQGGQVVPDEDAVSGGSGDAATGGQPHRTEPVFAPQAHHLLFDRGGRLVRAVVGRLERSCMPASHSCRWRLAQRAAVVWLTWKRSAARRSGRPSSTTHRARRSLPVGGSGALRWDTRASCGRV